MYHRLRAKSSATNYGYTYDASGNRTQLTIGASNYAYTIATTSNRLTATAGPSPARSFTFDSAGNVTADGIDTWSFNARGRMASTTIGANTVNYTYDGLGQRVIKSGPTALVPGGTLYYVYDTQGHLLGEYDSSGTVIQEYVYLNDALLAIVKGTTSTPLIYYAYTDQIGRPWVITNTSDVAVWQWDTAPFGEFAPNQNPSGLGTFNMNLRFPGQYADSETSLNYNYFRDYDARVGRYPESDPIGLRGGINTYLYGFANPVSFTDQTGEMASLPQIIRNSVVIARAAAMNFIKREPKLPSGEPSLPPEGVSPPVKNPEQCKVGPSSRGEGKSLWDPEGGEWRYKGEDQWHNLNRP